MLPNYNHADALLSEDGVHRYALSREWSGGTGLCGFIGLNPSTADADNDDPTIRRCVGFARDWGYAGIRVVNLFSLRTKSPALLKLADYPQCIGGARNEQTIQECVDACRLVVAAWGIHGGYRNRAAEVLGALNGAAIYQLGMTRQGYPRHPLYLPRGATAKPLVEQQ